MIHMNSDSDLCQSLYLFEVLFVFVHLIIKHVHKRLWSRFDHEQIFKHVFEQVKILFHKHFYRILSFR